MKYILVLIVLIHVNTNVYGQTADSLFNLAFENELKKVYNNNGTEKDSLNDFQGAIKEYSKAIEIDTLFAVAYFNRGLAKGKLEDYTGAITDFNRALTINPGDCKPYFNRGLAKIKSGDKNNGCMDLKRAVELGCEKSGKVIQDNCD